MGLEHGIWTIRIATVSTILMVCVVPCRVVVGLGEEASVRIRIRVGIVMVIGCLWSHGRGETPGTLLGGGDDL